MVMAKFLKGSTEKVEVRPILQQSNSYFLNYRKMNRVGLRPNQSLKLTELAVDDFARAKQPVTYWRGLSSRGLDSVAAALVAAA